MSATWKAAIGVILVFILGWIGGTVTTIVVARHKAMSLAQAGPEVLAIALERRTTRDLGLTPDQKDQLHAILVTYVRQRQDLQRTTAPQAHIINRQTLQQINALLTPAQQQHFHDNLVLFKQEYGRNPFSVGADERAINANATTSTEYGSGTNAPPALQ
jgi:hypothetical protein